MLLSNVVDDRSLDIWNTIIYTHSNEIYGRIGTKKVDELEYFYHQCCCRMRQWKNGILNARHHHLRLRLERELDEFQKNIQILKEAIEWMKNVS
jgi:hypothetical protein